MLGYIQVDGDDGKKNYQLTVHGHPVEEGTGWVYSGYNEKLSAFVYDNELYEQLTSLTFSKLVDSFDEVSISYPFYWEDNFNNFVIRCVEARRSGSTIELAFEFEFDIDGWRQPWTMGEHALEFRAVLESRVFLR